MRCDLSQLLARKITKRIHSSKLASLNHPIRCTLSSHLCQTHSESVLFTWRSVQHLFFGILKTQYFRAFPHIFIISDQWNVKSWYKECCTKAYIKKLKCLCVIISVFGWLSDKGQRKFITLLINNVVYTSVLTLCFSLTENLHQLCIVLNTATLKTFAKILGKHSFHGASQRTSATTIQL